MIVIIAGTRSFNNYKMLCDILNEYNNITKIVSGGASGADKLGEKYAKEKNIPLKIFPAEWNIYGKKAGPIRNEQMGDYADFLVAFWDGQSKGTKHMINYMKKIGKHGKVIEY